MIEWKKIVTRLLLRPSILKRVGPQRAANVMTHIWNQPQVELPACMTEGWEYQEPTASRALFLRNPWPAPVHGWTEAYGGWCRELPSSQQLRLCGEAALRTVVATAPRFQRFVRRKRLAISKGVTVGIVVTDRSGDNLIVVPWSAGEEWNQIKRRIIEMRRFFQSPLADLIGATAMTGDIPPMQVIVSTVAGYGIENPMPTIFACGGASPIEVTMGTRSTDFCFCHRLYDPQDYALFYKRFFLELERLRPMRITP